jgi:hypothetical protein
LSSCNTDKAKVFSCEHKCKTHGILLAVFNCGIVIGYRELFGKESTTQVALLYLDIYDYYIGIKLKISYLLINNIVCDVFIFLGKIPEFCVYDDACRLRRFLEKRINSRKYRPNRLENIRPGKIKYVVDRLHIKGHTEAWCLENCDPKLYPELKGVNTEACEQTNFFASGFKYTTKYQNALRFNFNLYIIFTEFNKIKINGKYIIMDSKKVSRAQAIKRKFDDLKLMFGDQ